MFGDEFDLGVADGLRPERNDDWREMLDLMRAQTIALRRVANSVGTIAWTYTLTTVLGIAAGIIATLLITQR